MKKLAIFGGSFNPVHWGHLLTAETALTQLNLDHVIWVPTSHPSYKSSSVLLDFHDRLEMISQAIAPHPQFTLSTIEQNRSGSSYAIDTLIDIQALYPNSQWYWVIGLDAFQSLPHWHRHQELLPHCEWLVAPRLVRPCSAKPQPSPPASLSQTTRTLVSDSHQTHATIQSAITRSDSDWIETAVTTLCNQVAQILAAESIDLKWQLLQMPLVEISSSLIRQRCQECRSIRYLVPDAVRSHIIKRDLYQNK
jgi:nicotinate-nucleotide adenylyltransferase